MLHKESAMAVMVAVMLGAASLLGGFATTVFATHDPDATQLASDTVSLAADESMVIDAVELTAKKSNSSASGTLIVGIVQGEEIFETEEIGARSISTIFNDFEIAFENLTITGDFQVVLMYEGNELVTIKDFDVLGVTAPAEEVPEGEVPSQDGTFLLTKFGEKARVLQAWDESPTILGAMTSFEYATTNLQHQARQGLFR